jgi:Cys-rich repeat protein
MSRSLSHAALLLAVAALACTKTPSTNKVVSCPMGQQANSAGVCVECLTTSDCAAGTFCNSASICTGCAQSPSSCSSGGKDGGNSNGSCSTDTDCPSGKYCDKYVCQPGCSTDSECPSGDVCTNNACISGGCMSDSACSGETCCSGVCTDTMSNNRANCGGCGAPACATGDTCCAGVCADTQTDPKNCGTCGNACGGTIGCSGGNCQTGYAILGLFDVTGKITIAGSSGTDGGSPADGGSTQSDGGSAASDGGTTYAPGTVEVLEPYVVLQAGNPPISATQAGLEQLLSGPVCQAVHYDSANPLPASLNAGTVTISGYSGGDLLGSSTAVPNQIQCAIVNGVYLCGYGALQSGMPGAVPSEQEFAPGTNALGGSSTVTFAAPGTPAGATSFGSFSVTSSGNTGLPVMEDLSTLTYSASADTVIHLVCPSGNCPLGGFFAIVQASSNPGAHFAEPATAGGAIFCVGAFGTVPVINQTLPAVVTFQSSDIATMLGSNATVAASITTFTTTVVTISEGSLTSLNGMDSEGHHVIPVAATGSFGVAAQN